MLHLNDTEFSHPDLHSTRISRDEADVKAFHDILESNWINPFSSDQQDLVCLSTGKLAPSDVERNLLCATQVGEDAYKSFSKQRLESSPPERKFHDTITKQKLKTFSDLNKKFKVQQGGSKEVVLRADRNLFAHMIVVAEIRDLQMSEVLQHPLGPLPWSPATSDGSLRKTNKSALAKEFQKNAFYAEDIGKPSACIIDGMSAVQKIKGDHKSFAEIALSLLSMILHESPDSERIDVVFDVYKEYSIKNTERSRGTTAIIGTQFKNIALRHKVQQ